MRKITIIICLFFLAITDIAIAEQFNKTIYEETFRSHDFYRLDGKGWVSIGETILSETVKVYERDTGIDKSSTMVSDIMVDGTKVIYKLKAGEINKYYVISIKIVTSTGNKLEDNGYINSDLVLKVTQ